MRYENLAQPIDIGSVRSRNRFMKNGTGFFWEDPGGYMNDRYIDYFEALAKGGVGLISSATSPLTRDANSSMPGYKIATDDYIPGWRRWAAAIHAHGALAFGQLFHLGPMAPLFATAPPGKSASAIPPERSPRPGFGAFTALSVAEIQDMVDLFAAAAERQKKAGLDGTEINAACNHLLNNFLSRAWNTREDRYGAQTLDNRTRLVVYIVHEIKRRNGPEWPIILLYNGCEVGLRDGISVEEAQQFARRFVAAGADALELRCEYYTWVHDVRRRESTHFPDMYFYPTQNGAANPYIDTRGQGAGANVPVAARIKQVVAVPVITVGAMDWRIGERAIARHEIDMISLNRRLFADPALPNKVLAGDVRDVNPCTSCMTCFDACEHFQPVVCRVNAAFGHERDYAIRPTRVKKSVVVVGGGPAGMEAARVAALRGHDVTLFERQLRLGGSLPVAALVKGPREDLTGLVRYLERQVRTAGVHVKVGRAATASDVEALHHDAVVLATGGRHELPAIPGIHASNVLPAQRLHRLVKDAAQVVPPLALRRLHRLPIARSLLIGSRVVVMGGRLHGCQVAEYLVRLGKHVTVVHSGPRAELGKGLLEVFLKPYLLYWLQDHGVSLLADATYREVTHDGLWIDDAEGTRRLLPADTIVTALPLVPDVSGARAFAGAAPEVIPIGDAAEPGLIIDAIAAGARAGREI